MPPPGPGSSGTNAVLQALRELTEAVGKASRATAANTQQTQHQAQAAQHGAGHAAASTGWQAVQHQQLAAIHNLQMGQAMGQRLGVDPFGQLQWQTPKGGGGFGGGAIGASGRAAGASAGMMGALGRFAGPLAALGGLHQLAGGITTTVAGLNDPYMTNNQLGRSIARQLPFGETAQGLLDAFSGRAAAMTEARRIGSVEHEQGMLRLGGFETELGVSPMRRGLEARSAAYKFQSAVLPPDVNRDTAAGEQRFKDLSRLVPLQQESARAEREMRKATAERVSTEHMASLALKHRSDLESKIAQQRKVREANTGTGGDEAARHEQATRLIEAYQAQLDAARGAHDNASRQVFEKRTNEAQAAAAYEKAKIREDKLGRADIVEDQAQRAKGTAARLGSMNPLERAQAAQAAKIAKQFGIDALPPELKAQFAAVAPKEYEAAALRAGADSDAFKELQNEGIVDAPGKGGKLFGAQLPNRSPHSLQNEADGLRRDAAQGEFNVDQKTAAVEADAASKLAGVLAASLNRVILMVEAKIDDKLRLGKN